MTFFETANQAFAFLLLLYAGMAGGMLYDFFALFRRRMPGPAGVLLDMLWCLVLAALCGLCLAIGGEGRVRLFALLGLCCGGGIYCLGVRAAINAVIRRTKSRKKPRARRNSPETDGKGMGACAEE